MRRARTEQARARTDFGHGRCAGLLTRRHLAPSQVRSWCTEHIPVRDIALDRAPFATPDMPAATAAVAMRIRGLGI